MATDKSNKIPNAPNLRFPEFVGEWEEDIIGNVAPLQRGFDLPNQNIENGEYPVVYSNGILRNHKYYQCEAPGLVTGRSGSIGNFTYIQEGKYWPHNTSLWVTNFNGNWPKFIYYLYQTINIEQYATGSGVPTLNRNDVHKHIVSVPPLVEQKKISEFLSVVDQRIATQIVAIEKMESLIKGITLSVINGKGVKKVLLGELLTERNEKNTDHHEVYSVAVREGVVNQIEHLGRSFSAADTSHYNVVHHGDIVYTKSPTGEFPYGIVKRSDVDKCVAVSPLYGVYKPMSDNIAIWLHHYFDSPISANNYLHKLIQKGAKNTINITNQRFLENYVPIPENVVLSVYCQAIDALENKLMLERELLDAFRQQKAYLLKNMFV